MTVISSAKQQLRYVDVYPCQALLALIELNPLTQAMSIFHHHLSDDRQSMVICATFFRSFLMRWLALGLNPKDWATITGEWFRIRISTGGKGRALRLSLSSTPSTKR
jgi:hypothetical protein